MAESSLLSRWPSSWRRWFIGPKLMDKLKTENG